MSTLQTYTFTPLPTDWLLYLIVACVLLGGWITARSKHLRGPWQRVFKRPVAMVSIVVIMFYVFIGLLDSIHFTVKSVALPVSNAMLAAHKKSALLRINNSVTRAESVQYSKHRSLLEMFFQSMNDVDEKTYSAPFALHRYSRSVVVTASGKREQVYKSLNYSGHRNLSDSRVVDIFYRVLIGGMYTLLVISSLFMLSMFLFLGVRRTVKGNRIGSSLYGFCKGAKQVMMGSTEYAWRSAVVTCAVLLLLLMVLYQFFLNYHVLGTNQIGEDILYISFKSIRTGLLIGVLSTLFMLPFAVVFGLCAGFFGGWVDDLIQYIYTTVSSIPGVLLISACLLIMKTYIYNQAHLATVSGSSSIFLNSHFRDDCQFLGLCVILGLTSWAGLCRLLRAETIKLRAQPFVIASQALGQKSSKILFKHILPNVMHIIVITIVLDFSGLVLAEAVLTYVGVGVPTSIFSWGNMINQARSELSRSPVVWWPLFSAMSFMFIFVLSINLFADAVRDAFDPRCR